MFHIIPIAVYTASGNPIIFSKEIISKRDLSIRKHILHGFIFNIISSSMIVQFIINPEEGTEKSKDYYHYT
jgi:hypothetical protein